MASITDVLRQKGLKAVLVDPKAKPTTIQKAGMIAKAGREQIKKVTKSGWKQGKNSWIRQDEYGQWLLQLRYKNKTIPLEGNLTFLLCDSKKDACDKLAALCNALTAGDLNDMVRGLEEPARSSETP